MTREEVERRVAELFAATKADDPDGKVEKAVVGLVVQLLREDREWLNTLVRRLREQDTCQPLLMSEVEDAMRAADKE